MGVTAIYVIASAALLAVTTTGVAREKLEVSNPVCMVAVPSITAVGSGFTIALQSLLGLHVFAVPAGFGVVILVQAAFVVATD